MYNRLVNIFIELVLVVTPGINRITPIILLPILINSEEASSVISNLSLSSVIVLITAIGFINTIISSPAEDRINCIHNILSINIYVFIFIFTISLLCVFFLNLSIDLLIIPLWVLSWGGYQIYRTYMIFEDKNKLFKIELIIITSWLPCTLLVYFFNELFYVYSFITLIPFVFFLFHISKKVNNAYLTSNFLISAFEFSLANLFSMGMFALFPFILNIKEVDSNSIIIASTSVNLYSVSMLLNRALSNNYLPKLKKAINNKSIIIYKEFVFYNFIVTIIAFPLIAFILDCYIRYSSIYRHDNTSSLIVFLLGLVVGFSQLILPISNLLALKGQSKYTLLINGSCFFIFLFSAIFGYIFEPDSPILVYLYSMLIANIIRCFVSYLIEKKIISHGSR